MSNTSISIPQTDPQANYLAHRDEIDAAIHRVLESGWYILGQEVSAFEAEFAAYVGVTHGIGVGNGTDALEIALRACGVGPGDAVMTVSHTAVATVAAIESAGATPVLVDIDPLTYTMDPVNLEETLARYFNDRELTNNHPLKAIIPVHLYGHPVDMTAILHLARRYHLSVVEDCAQSHGAALQGRRTGAWGDVAAFSFYPTKNLGALGDGGIIVTNNSDLAERSRLLRQYGWRQRYISEIPGGNSRLDELQAAVLRVKLRYLDVENTRRRELARIYTHFLADTDLVLPACRPDAEHVYHQYVIRAPMRDALQVYLRTKGIGTLIHYPQPIHLQPAYAGRMFSGSGLPNSEKVAGEVLSLPMIPELSDAQVTQTAKAIHRWYVDSHA